jgi:hypothetical protein
MTVDVQITDYQCRIVWLIGGNDPQKATYQITHYHVRVMLTATVATESAVVVLGANTVPYRYKSRFRISKKTETKWRILRCG